MGGSAGSGSSSSPKPPTPRTPLGCSHALHANGVRHLHPRTPKAFEAAVSQYRTSSTAGGDVGAGPSTSAAPAAAAAAAGDASEQVLLLLVKQGGNGLNLTAAQHVVVVEPLLDPAAEAQAVGRVHRIGQRAETHVHR